MKNHASGRFGIWPVLTVLLMGVLVPTACVLWFMNAAIQNESLAVRQRLTDIYRQKLERSSSSIEGYWKGTFSEANKVATDKPAFIFAYMVRNGVADSVIIYNKAGEIAYPSPTEPALPHEENSPRWLQARQLEYENKSFQKAAEIYAKIAADAKNKIAKSSAIQAQVRCLVKADLGDQALKILGSVKSEPDSSPNSRAIALNAHLLKLQILKKKNSKSFGRQADKFEKYISNYNHPIASNQRCFLMQSLDELLPGTRFDTLGAEEIAADYIDSQTPPARKNILTITALPELWQTGCNNDRIILLYRQQKLIEKLISIGGLNESFSGVEIKLLPPNTAQDNKPFLKMAACKHMPGWELAVYLIEDPFTAAASRQKMIYLWIGSVGIMVMALIALLAGHYIRRQMKLTKLKNDFIATVSHELKTPLASMRVLVDTLLEGRCSDPERANEYLQLISKENKRLSRMIDNFLTFSRMERNKRAFSFENLDPGEIIDIAVSSVSERFANSNCQLNVEMEDNLPQISADKDAIITVLLNLLDNSWKYSGEHKQITLRAFLKNNSVCFSVEDNGIGMDNKAVRRIFNRFYQVDQTLSRSTSGCGLGLSIVKFILDAHGGKIDVKSQPGKGSMFIVKLPTCDSRYGRTNGGGR